MRILALGDIVGRPGRQAVAELLPQIVQHHKLDLVVANAENVAGGSGITANLFRKLRANGIACITLGDHAFRKSDILPILDSSDRIVRPANVSRKAAGKTYVIVPARVKLAAGGEREVPVAVFCLAGRLFMPTFPADSPFDAADRIFAQLPPHVKVAVVDVHAEATSEKIALGYHLAGRASLVFGTHTHTPTADAKILPPGTAYITDVGMCGPYDSVLGRKKEAVLSWMAETKPERFDVATGDVRLCGVIADVDEGTGRATAVERFEASAGNSTQAYDAEDSANYRDE